MRTGVIIQARMSSTRLPGKIAKELPYGSGITVLEQVIRRLKKCKQITDIIVATTTDREDIKAVKLAKKEKVAFFRGSKEDVLSRYYFAAKKYKLDTIVRVTSDCPCIDFNVADDMIKSHFKSKADYTSNTVKRSFPHGLDIEVFSFEVLEKIHSIAKNKYEREHVTLGIYKRPEMFNINSVKSSLPVFARNIRITVDTIEDYALLCAVYDFLYKKNRFFTAKEIAELFKNKPWLYLINKKVKQKKAFNNLNDELKEAVNVLNSRDLKRAENFIAKNIKK